MAQLSCTRVTTMRVSTEYSLPPAQVICCTKHLSVMLRKYGCNICGEGGEYETLTLDCPVFRQASIVLETWQPLLHSEDSVARVGVLHPMQFHLKAKVGTDAVVTIAMGDVLDVPPEGAALERLLASAHRLMISLAPPCSHIVMQIPSAMAMATVSARV